MSIKLYVGNLSFDTTSDDLNQLFSQNGTVESASVITDRDTGRSRGFAFVEMADRAEGMSAIRELNGIELHGRDLTVNEARAKEQRPSGGRDFGGSRGNGRSRY